MRDARPKAAGSGFVCPWCFRVLSEAARVCPDCAGARPESGWPPLPFAFRGRYLLVEQLELTPLTASFRAEPRDGVGEAVLVKIARLRQGKVPPQVTRLLRREATMSGLLAEETEAFFSLSGVDLGEPPYLVFELCPWPSLRALLTEQGPLDAVVVARIGAAILHGLTALERHHLVHAALTPARIFAQLCEGGQRYDVKIAGIGVVPDPSDEGALPALDLSVLPYTSPEQLRAETFGAASDTFMVACLLWELCTGAPPHATLEGSTPAKAAAHRLRALERPPARPDGLPAELHALLIGAMLPDPKRRGGAAASGQALSSLSTLGSALERFAEEHPARQARELAGARDELGRVEALLAAMNDKLAPLQTILDRKATIEAAVLRLSGAATDPEDLRRGAHEAEGALRALASEIDDVLGDDDEPSEPSSPPALPVNAAPRTQEDPRPRIEAAAVIAAPAMTVPAPPPVVAAAPARAEQDEMHSAARAPEPDPSSASSAFFASPPAESVPPPSLPSEEEAPSSDPGDDEAEIPGVGGARWPYVLVGLGAALLGVVIVLVSNHAAKGPSTDASAMPSASVAPTVAFGATPSAASASARTATSAAAPATSATASPSASTSASASASASASVSRPVAPPPRPRPQPASPPEDEAAPAEEPTPY